MTSLRVRGILIVTCYLILVRQTIGAEWHVSVTGNDRNEGTKVRPLRTVCAAAERAQPGDVVIVHAGVYRERVDPPRGGESETRRITYEAAPDERAEITGSDPVTGWKQLQAGVWQATIPSSRFGRFNPFADFIHGDWFSPRGFRPHTGAVYVNGDWLAEAASRDDVLKPVGAVALWFATVQPDHTTLLAQFKDVDPNTQQVEVNVRQSVFYPSKTGINYITVRGFILSNAATPWAPPTAEQIGLVGTNWSRGWVIENNQISHSICSGVSLGKYGDVYDNTSASTANGYVKTIERAMTNGWNKDTVGHHVVRNNTIAYCEQAGIVGSLGGIFSTISGNVIHDIHVRNQFDGAEMAGIKLHGAIDVQIAHNYIYRTYRGIWLDWMAQGTQVTGNLLNANASDKDLTTETPNGGRQDMFLEVNHGPIVVDNNLFLSTASINTRSQGIAYAHNLFAGAMRIVAMDKRLTPYLKAHSTEVVALHNNPAGDVRFYNNIFVQRADLSPYDTAALPVIMQGNVFIGKAKPSTQEGRPMLEPGENTELQVIEKPDGVYLQMSFDVTRSDTLRRPLVTTELLGKAAIPNQSFERPDGTTLRIDTDYFGQPRSETDPSPGPFEHAPGSRQVIRVWPLSNPN